MNAKKLDLNCYLITHFKVHAIIDLNTHQSVRPVLFSQRMLLNNYCSVPISTTMNKWRIQDLWICIYKQNSDGFKKKSFIKYSCKHNTNYSVTFLYYLDRVDREKLHYVLKLWAPCYCRICNRYMCEPSNIKAKNI